MRRMYFYIYVGGHNCFMYFYYTLYETAEMIFTPSCVTINENLNCEVELLF